MHCRTQCPHPAAGHHQPMPPPETSGHSWACLGQSLVGSLLLSPGPWGTQGSICALPESVSPVLCKFWWLCGGLNCDLLQEGLCQTQVYCTQSPCPHSSPLLTHSSSGDTQTQVCLSLCGISGSWCTQGMFEPSEHLWRVWGLILNSISHTHTPHHLSGAFPLPLDIGYCTVAPAPCSHHSSCAATAPVAQSKGTVELKNNNNFN